MKITLQFLLTLLVTGSVFAQQDGEYLSSAHPANNLWEADGHEGAVILDGMAQQFFFLIPDGSEGSMMAPFHMDGMGFACPTYFTVSLDEEYLYLDIGKACAPDLPEEEKYIKLAYRVDDDKLILIIDGEEYRYREWMTEESKPDAESPERMALEDEDVALELLSKGGWHPATMGGVLYKGAHSIRINKRMENVDDSTLDIKGDGDNGSFEIALRFDAFVEDDYLMLEIWEEDADKFCSVIYVYFEDDNHAFFYFTNTWVEPIDEELKGRDWIPSRR